MITVQLKLRPTKAQERQLQRWLWHLTGVFNWAVRKLELDARDSIYHTRYDIEKLVSGHGPKIGVGQVVLADAVRTAHDAWKRHLKGLGRRPRLKSRRNRLNSIGMHQRIQPPNGRRIRFQGFGVLKFHRQDIPAGAIKGGRIVRRASGWYLCLFIDAQPRAIPQIASGQVGIDPGFASLLTLSNGEKIGPALEQSRLAERLAQSQRGSRKRLTARLLEHQANQRRDRNHKLSRRIVSENVLIAWSADHHRGIARSFGKSVRSASHGQLREMLAYKCRTDGREFVEVSPRNSTRTCSACLALSGPTGWAGLSVRHWSCGVCGTPHDRDVNAALNTLRVGRGIRLESGREAASGTAA